MLTSKQQKPKCNTDMHRLYTHCSYVPSIGLVPDICRGDWADQQPSSPRRPNVCLWPNSRLKQTSSDTQGDVSVCYSTGLEPTATGACCPKAAELPLQLGTCTADDSSTNTRKDQVSWCCLRDLPRCEGLVFVHWCHAIDGFSKCTQRWWGCWSLCIIK